MINYRTDWIADISIPDKLARTLAERMSEAIEDSLSEIAENIAMDYTSPPEGDEDPNLDTWNEVVIEPLYDHLLNQIVGHLLPGDEEVGGKHRAG